MAQENPELSLDAASRRQWRSNTICETLAGLGHTVVRWRSSFSHQQKKQLSDASIVVPSANYLLQYIKVPSYKNHVGLARIRSHRALASNFLRLANEYNELPDLIHVGNVPIELCAAAVSFGRSNDIPVVVDVRDLWPDTYIDFMPSCLSIFRPFLLWLIRSFSFRARFCYKNATAINGLTCPSSDGVLIGLSANKPL